MVSCWSPQGSVAIGGQSVRWLRDNLEFFKEARDIGVHHTISALLPPHEKSHKHSLTHCYTHAHTYMHTPHIITQNSMPVVSRTRVMCTLYRPSLVCLLHTGNLMLEGGVCCHGCIHLLSLILAPPTHTHRVIIGLTNYTTKAHLCRATLEAVCFQSREVSGYVCQQWWDNLIVLKWKFLQSLFPI